MVIWRVRFAREKAAKRPSEQNPYESIVKSSGRFLSIANFLFRLKESKHYNFNIFTYCLSWPYVGLFGLVWGASLFFPRANLAKDVRPEHNHDLQSVRAFAPASRWGE